MKNILLFVFALASTGITFAQDYDSVSYGFRLGVNSSNISGDNIPTDLNSRIGLHANFFADITLNDTFSLQPEIGVSALGVNENEFRNDAGAITTFKTNWLHVNVLAKVDLSRKIYFLLGPQAGVAVDEGDGISNDYNFDLAGVAGIGYMLDENWSIDGRYGYSIPNFNGGSDSEPANRWFQLGISYRL